jgi:hypothetical protein
VTKEAKSSQINGEIILIRKSIVMSSSFSPFLSVENFERKSEKLELKYAKVIPMQD